MKSIKLTTLFLLIFTATQLFAQQTNNLPAIHSHNDYESERPIFNAIEAQAKIIEIDIFLQEGKLLVAHTKADLEKAETIETQYLIPLKKYLTTTQRKYNFQLMIDLKTQGESTMKTLAEILSKYPEIFIQKNIGVLISGNRPRQVDYPKYASYITFDGRSPEEISKPGGQRISMVSQNLSKFTRWRADGEIPANDLKSLKKFVNDCHQQNVKVRFWNTGEKKAMIDFLCDLGVDYISSDAPKQLRKYLDSKR